MKTYQELTACGADERRRGAFVRDAVREHRGSAACRAAASAEAYYAKRNLTIEKFQKFLYAANGQAYPDLFSANYRLKTLFFRRFVIQQVQYVLSNGVIFEDSAVKAKLGSLFDARLTLLAKKAMVDGVAFGFWNYDHLEVFPFADTPLSPGFAPLYDERDGALRAGVRYWRRSGSEVRRYTLYEADGYTEYIGRKGEEIEPLRPKRSYTQRVTRSQADGERVEDGENYAALPILPLYANDLRESELIGIRESIDCYDFIKSGLANEIDDASGIYWIIKNAGGMDDTDLAQFLDRLRTVRAATVGEEESVEEHTLKIPYEARSAMLDRLRRDLYEDFQLVDMEKVLSGNLTATAIRMGYQMQDDKCADFEYCLRDFVQKLLTLLGLEGEPTFRWNRVANQLEETQMVLSAAPYLDDETLLNHLPWLTPEEVQAVLRRRDAEAFGRIEVTEDGRGAQADRAEAESNREADHKNVPRGAEEP